VEYFWGKGKGKGADAFLHGGKRGTWRCGDVDLREGRSSKEEKIRGRDGTRVRSVFERKVGYDLDRGGGLGLEEGGGVRSAKGKKISIGISGWGGKNRII